MKKFPTVSASASLEALVSTPTAPHPAKLPFNTPTQEALSTDPCYKGLLQGAEKRCTPSPTR